jgi:hypothetical protein
MFSIPTVAPKRTLLFRISLVLFFISFPLTLISIIFFQNNFTDALFFILTGISLIMLLIKNHKIEGEIHFSPDTISIDTGKKKITFLVSDIIKITFRINEFKGQKTYILNPMMAYSEEGIYNYLEIITANKKEKYELLLTKKNFKQLNSLFDKLNSKLETRLSIYHESKKVQHLAL